MIDLFFDTETTGLITNTLRALDKQPHVTEFYACRYGPEGFIDELDLLINPTVKIPAELEKKVGITNEMVADCPTFAFYGLQIKEYIESADRIIAHNCAFDLAMTTIEFKRLAIDIKFPAVKLCTVEATEHLKGKRLSLSDLHELLFGEPFKGAHRAKVDVSAMKRCFDKLREDGEI